MAVAARDLQHSEDFAKKHNIPRVYGSYDELAKDPDIGVFFCQHMALLDLGLYTVYSLSSQFSMIPDHMWCPTSLEANGKEMQFPLPEAGMPLNFTNSTGLRYEAEEVRQCLLKGLKESPGMPWAHSSLKSEVLDEARRQLGVTYDQDNIQ